MKHAVATHPAFVETWKDLQRAIGGILAMSRDRAVSRCAFSGQVAIAKDLLDRLDSFSGANGIQPGERVTVTAPNFWQGQEGTVISADGDTVRVSFDPSDKIGILLSAKAVEAL